MLDKEKWGGFEENKQPVDWMVAARLHDGEKAVLLAEGGQTERMQSGQKKIQGGPLIMPFWLNCTWKMALFITLM